MAKKIEVNQEVIIIRSKIDRYVEEVKEIDSNIAEFEALYVARLEELEKQYQNRVLNLKANRDRLMGEISGYFDLAEPKETKTQEKLSLLSGDVVRKKATIKLVADKEKLIEWAEKNEPRLIKVKEVKTIEWANMKYDLVAQQDIDGNYVVMNTATGEVMDCVEVEEVETRMEVK